MTKADLGRLRRPDAAGPWLALALLAGMAVLRLPAAEVITGQPGVPEVRSVLNLRGAAEMERLHGTSNTTQRAIPAPMPLDRRSTNGPGGGGGGLQAAGALPSGGDLQPAGTGLPPSPLPSVSFQALPDNDVVIPPDTHGAVGPNHVFTVLNSQVRVQDRSGNALQTLDLGTFWQGLGVADVFDPKALYDPYGGRWIFTAMAERLSDRSSVLLAVSQTDDPTGNWFRYRVDADAQNLAWADYPSLGFNKDWIVVSVNMFPIIDDGGIGYTGVSLFAFNKTNLYANGTGAFTLLRDNSLGGFTMVPAITMDATYPVMHLVEVENLVLNYTTTSRRLRLSTITGPVGAEVLSLGTGYTTDTNVWASAAPFDPFLGGFGQQLNSFFLIDHNDSRVQNVVYRNGSLWAAHHVHLPANLPTRTSVLWWQMATNGVSTQIGLIDDPGGTNSYAFPSIAVNRNDDALIGFSRFSAFQYPSANYAFRACSDPPNCFRGDVVLKNGEGEYYKTFFGLANRWGDYSSTVVDPLNDLDFWTIQEYAALPVQSESIGFQGRWGTWWGKVEPAASCTKVEFKFAQYVVEEDSPGFASISVINIGGAAGTVDFATSDGTALAGQDYLARTGTIVFEAGQLETNFLVVILDNAVVNTNKTFNLSLFNASGPAELGRITNAVVIINDDETSEIVTEAGEFNFSSYLNNGVFYLATEYETSIAPAAPEPYTITGRDRTAPGVLVTVVRTNGARGRVLVDYATAAGGTAIPFSDYVPVQGTMVFDDRQTSTNFLVEVFPDFNLFSTGSRFIRVVLSNPRPAPEEETARPGTVRPRLGLGSESGILIYTLGITNIFDAYSFERRNWRTDEYATDNQVGGYRVFYVQVVGPQGQVRLTTREHPDGGGWRRWVLNRTFLNAGADFAEAEDPGGFQGFNVWPNPTYTDSSLSTITNFSDYLATNVVLTFTDIIQRRNVLVVVTNDPTVEFNEDLWMVLEPIPNNPPVHPLGRYGSLTILHKDQPAGALDREWNVYNLSSSDPPFNRTPGANNTVRALVVQPDGSTVLGGDFTHVNAQRRPGIARMQPNGHVDRTFDPGDGVAGGFVAALALYPTNFVLDAGKILVGGGFAAYNGRQRNGIARVLPNGQLDTTFDPGNGANGPVWSIALQSDGRILVAGSFTEFNDFPRSGVARLNSDGSLDLTFDPGTGADGTIWSIGLSRNGTAGEQIVLGGDFVFFDGEYHAGVVRLNSDGSIDPNFETGGGVLGSVYALAVATNNSVLVAGYFTEIDARRRINLARFRSDGSLDPDFDPGFGTDGPVLALTLQPDGKPLIGGPFTEFNGTRRLGFARLRLNGTLDTSFLDTAYNQFAGLINTFSFEEPKYVAALAVQPDGNIMIGGSFTNIGGNPSIRAPLRNDWTVFTRADKQVRFNIARVIGGTTPGPGNAEFDSPEYYVDENADLVSVQLQRTDGRLGSLVAQAEAADRVATNQLDYVVTNRVNLWREGNQTPPVGGSAAPVSVGQVSPAYFRIPILNDTLQEGDETVDLSFVRPDGSITLGGEFIPLGGALGRASAVLNIADDDVDHGVFNFLAPNYYTDESALRAEITIIRTNGSSGPATVHFFTRTSTNTPIATANEDYVPTAQTLFFGQNETSKVVRVTLREDNQVEFDENIELVLTNATGGAKLPGGLANSIATATLTIIDPDFPPGRLSFDAAVFTTNETAGFATISVRRSGGNSGSVSIDFATGNGTATAPGDYLGVTGTLDWDDEDSGTKTFTIPLVADGVVDGPPFETVNLRLLNPRLGTVLNTNLFGFRTNAVLQIQEADSYGALAFSQPVYQADENGGAATITVVRRGGIAGTVSCNFGIQPYDPLSPGRDYLNTNGTLVFLPGEISKSFTITLLDDSESDDNQGLILTLTNPTNAVLGTPGEATLTLVDNESYAIPAGELDPVFRADTQVNGPVLALGLQADERLLVAGEFTEVNNVNRRRVARLNADGTLDASFDPAFGPNDSVRALTLQPDSKILLGGLFTQYNGTNRGRITRVNSDGTIDTTFAVGAAANNPVFAITLQADDKILVGGSFSTFNGVPRAGIVRLNTNGTLDATFNPGAGANNAVYAVAVQGDGKIVIGGEFTLFNGQSRGRIARLNRDGSLDSSFNVSASFSAAVRALLIQPDGKIVVGGSFTNANGITRNYIARLNTDGTLDTGFLASPLTGADSAVYALGQQVDGKIVVAGDFRLFNGVTRRRLTRLNPDGSNDPTINFGSGTDSYIAAVLIQPDRKIVIGGDFTTYNDQPRRRVARLHGGSVAGAGALEFVRAEFLVDENATNALITVRRRFGTTGTVSVNYQTVDGTAIAGVDYTATAGTLQFPPAETRQEFLVPILDNSVPNGDRRLRLELINGSLTGGAVSGPQPVARLIILDNEGEISFSSADYNVGENVASGFATIAVRRSGATNQPATVDFRTVNGTALAGADYFTTNGTMAFAPGEASKSFHVRIVNDTNSEPNELIQLELANPSGSNTLDIATATLLVVDDDFAAGQFVLSSGTYVTNETAPYALITVLRTNGTTGFATVAYRTADSTALAGQDYVGTNGLLAFADGELAKSFIVPILDDLLVEGSEVFTVIIEKPTGGPVLGSLTSAGVTILSDDISLIVEAGASLVSESFLPANNAIDPGETVTVALTLRNDGTGSTSNLVATLLPTGGVTAPSGPQTYGVILPGLTAVQNFSFTAVGSTGSLLVATLRLTDGAITNGFPKFEFTLGGSASRTVTNATEIVINDNTSASVYPSTININNMGGRITRVGVTLLGFAHTFPDDVDVLLVGPGGQRVTLMSDAGGSFAVRTQNISFSATSLNVLPNSGQIAALTYLPTNYAGPGTADTFPPPAPQPSGTDPFPYTNSALAVFTNTSPNGTWNLFVVDDDVGEVGRLGGWALDLTTSDTLSAPANLLVAASADLHQVALGAEFESTIVISNRGPASAGNVALVNLVPAGLNLTQVQVPSGTWGRRANALTWRLPTLARNSAITMRVRMRPSALGTHVSTFTVGADQSDLAPADNTTSLITTVVAVPELTIARQGSALRIAWPATGYVLQAATNLAEGGWSDVGVAPQVSGGQNVVTVGANGGYKFFRLRSP